MPKRNRRREGVAPRDDGDEDGLQLDPTSMTVAQLKAELKHRGLDTHGRKHDLVTRLSEVGA